MIKLCHEDDLAEGTVKGFSVDYRQQPLAVFVVTAEDGLHVYVNSCPHTGVTLDWVPDQFLDISGQYLQCATHGALFRKHDGYCVFGPCRGKSLQEVGHVLRDGHLYLQLPEAD